jgi:hypothetical protein
MHFKYPARMLVAFLACVAAGGCTYRIVLSQDASKDAAAQPDALTGSANSAKAERGGLVYFLPMTLIAVSGEIKDEVVKYTVTPTIVPDPRASYRLRYVPGSATDDDLGLSVDKNGLLSGATKANITDRTGDIIIALAKTGAAGQTSTATPPDEPVRDADAYPFTVIYDVDTFVKGVTLPDNSTITVEQKWLPQQGGYIPPCTYSVCFRTVIPIHAHLTNGTRKNDFAFVAINASQTEGIDLISANLVARTNNLTFESGLLTTVAINQPSTTLAIVNLPLAVLKAILSVPAELLTIKIKNVQAEADLLKAQADVLAQAKALVDAQQALQNARNQAAGAARSTPVVGTGSSP